MQHYIASDHAGFRLKNLIKTKLKKEYDFKDLGMLSDERCDYPKIAITLAKKVAKEKDSLGMLICGTGIGMSIVANKVKGARAAVIYDGFTAKMSRQHNNANIACIGARNMTGQTAIQLVRVFLRTGLLGREKGGERHHKRIEIIEKIEKQHFI